jgi:hypothetical protein
MSYILFATSGGGLATPVSVANGGTGADNTKDALVTLTSPAFQQSATEPSWGTIPVMSPPSPDPADLEASIQELLSALQTLMIIQVI